jgi:lysyl-tRNA synthetase class 2
MPSSVIRSFNFDPQHRELHIVFQSGRHYVYRDVPDETYEAMRKAFSKGEYFNAHVRDQFEFVERI